MGALVLSRLLQRMQCARVTFSTYGLREGYLYHQLPAAVQAEDPLLSAAAEIAELEARFGGPAERLITWCDALFPDEHEEQRRLLPAHCHLSALPCTGHPSFPPPQPLRPNLHPPPAPHA